MQSPPRGDLSCNWGGATAPKTAGADDIGGTPALLLPPMVRPTTSVEILVPLDSPEMVTLGAETAHRKTVNLPAPSSEKSVLKSGLGHI